jgi:hypothetical protein
MDDYEMRKHKELRSMVDTYHASQKKTTGIEAVLWYMIEHREDRVWWWSYEFVGKTTKRGDWLSHRAPARASDLALKHPDLVEDHKIGRLKVYRLRLENKDKIKAFLGIE